MQTLHQIKLQSPLTTFQPTALPHQKIPPLIRNAPQRGPFRSDPRAAEAESEVNADRFDGAEQREEEDQ